MCCSARAREQAQGHLRKRSCGKVSYKVTLESTFPWNLLTGALELRLGAEAGERPDCLVAPLGAFDLVRGKRFRTDWQSLCWEESG